MKGLLSKREALVMSSVMRLSVPSADECILEWANECLREALQTGCSAEVPVYTRALEHAASVKAGQQMKVVIGGKGYLDQVAPTVRGMLVPVALERRLSAAV